MTAIMISAVAVLVFPIPDAAPQLQPTMTGYLSQYGPQTTAGTIAYRQEVGDLPEDMSGYDGVIAVENCAHVGKDAQLSINGSPWLDVIIFDCLGRNEYNWMQERGIIGEVGYGLAERFDFVGRGGIKGQMVIQ